MLPNIETVCHLNKRLKCSCDASFTDVISQQIPIAYSFLVLGPVKEVLHEHSFAGKNAHVNLVRHLLDQEDIWIENLLTVHKDMEMTKRDKIHCRKQTECYICFKDFSETVLKVRDHSQFNYKHLGAARQSYNLRRKKSKRIPIFMHNGFHFDLHFIVKALASFGEEINNLSLPPHNRENFRTLSFNCFEFIDSLAFFKLL